MFDIGFQELLFISIIALLVMGPERLPGAIRTTTLWLSRLRRSFQQVKSEIEREVGADEIRQQLHNESIMKSLEQTKSDIQDNFQHSTDSLKSDLDKLQGDITEPAKTSDEPAAKS